MQLRHILFASLATLIPATGAVKIHLAGDSTMASWHSEIQGWGVPFTNYIQLPVVNHARGGRSARSYWREGLFDSLVEQIQEGDYVIIEFGHNDGGAPHTSDRAPTYGSGEDTTTVKLANGQTEVVQTFVTYEKWMAQKVIDHGGIPIISSMTPNGDSWKPDHKTVSSPSRFVIYASLVPERFNRESVVYYIDHWAWVGIQYRDMGYDNVYPKLFPNDHTHTSPEGADAVARAFVNGLKCTGHPLSEFLTYAGNEIREVCE